MGKRSFIKTVLLILPLPAAAGNFQAAPGDPATWASALILSAVVTASLFSLHKALQRTENRK